MMATPGSAPPAARWLTKPETGTTRPEAGTETRTEAERAVPRVVAAQLFSKFTAGLPLGLMQGAALLRSSEAEALRVRPALEGPAERSEVGMH
jgi:hypothetical protein